MSELLGRAINNRASAGSRWVESRNALLRIPREVASGLLRDLREKLVDDEMRARVAFRRARLLEIELTHRDAGYQL